MEAVYLVGNGTHDIPLLAMNQNWMAAPAPVGRGRAWEWLCQGKCGVQPYQEHVAM
jgi:hypothetical protein